MPQPIPHRADIKPFNNRPRIILERPKLAALIGAIAAEWGTIDDCLVGIYDTAVSHPGGVARAVNPVNVAVFEELGALNPRLDIIETVLKMRLPSLSEKFAGLRKALRKSAGERAKFVHQNWSVSDDFPDDLCVARGDGNVRYQEYDFTQALDRAVEMRKQVQDFLVESAHAPRVAT
jgi:hypothetical protein